VRWLTLLVLLATTAVACADTTATESVGYSPVTGIVVRSESAVGDLGCGPSAGQVFKYVAVLRGPSDLGYDAGADAGLATPDQVLGIGVYDCFSDGLFNELAVDASYGIELFGFSKAVWDQSGGPIGTLAGTPPTSAADASAQLLALKPISKTSCSAVQRTGIQTVASCPAPQHVAQ
jgi:hypothetical protein